MHKTLDHDRDSLKRMTTNAISIGGNYHFVNYQNFIDPSPNKTSNNEWQTSNTATNQKNRSDRKKKKYKNKLSALIKGLNSIGKSFKVQQKPISSRVNEPQSYQRKYQNTYLVTDKIGHMHQYSVESISQMSVNHNS